MSDFDGAWKEILDELLELCFALLFPRAHAAIDWSRGVEMLDKEFQKLVSDSKVGRRYVDKLVKVWLRNGQSRWLLIHIELQSQSESDFAQRQRGSPRRRNSCGCSISAGCRRRTFANCFASSTGS